MDDNRTTVRTSIDIALPPVQAFDVLVDELTLALVRGGLVLEAGPYGRVVQSKLEVGRVVSWIPGELILLQWRQADWQPDELTEVELRFEPVEAGTRMTLEHRGWGGLLGGPNELVGWFASEVAAPFLQATAPARLGNWLTDRRARRPSGPQARAMYRDPIYHYPNFRVILAELALTSADYLLEVGCGGGALLREALKSECRAAAVDHSPDMVRLAQEVNRDAVAEGTAGGPAGKRRPFTIP
jgi:hypothetical protein